MKRGMLRIGMVLALLLMVAGVDAQKIDGRLTRLMEQTTMRRAQGMAPVNMEGVKKTIDVDFNADGTLRSISAIATLKKGAECPTERLEQMGIKVRYVLGDMVSLRIPASQLMALEQVEEFRYVAADEMQKKMNEEARKLMGVERVNTKEAAEAEGLPEAYTGKGVVLGIIDAGIDFNHAAFRNSDGTTRIKKVILYSKDSDDPQEYTTEDEIKQLTTDDPNDSHGTHTAATAGGSILGNGQQGMAPETDLVLCGLYDKLTAARINSCVQKIFDYADEVKKPAVVSISLGSDIGLHDGSNLRARAVAELTENGTKPGRVVLVSSSNSAKNYQSIIKALKFSDADESGYHLKTVLGASKVLAEPIDDCYVLYNQIYFFYAGDYKALTPGLGVVDLRTGELVPLADAARDLNGMPFKEDNLPSVLHYTEPTLAGGEAETYYINFQSENVYLTNANYRFVLVVKAGSDGQVVKMMCNGDGDAEPCFDVPEGENIYDFKGHGFTKGNGDFACNTAICDDATIGVGAFCSRVTWTNHVGDKYSYLKSPVTGVKQVVGEIADFSSYCIDDNGKPRPTMIAPGKGIISSANNYDSSLFAEIPGEVKDPSAFLIGNVEKFDRNNWYFLSQGTSMSCPAAAGVVALWMQANPQLTVKEILEIIKETCDNDEWTTDEAKIPSHNKVQAGFGKLNCLKGLKKILSTNAISVVNRDGERHATPATMYNVDAPVYNVMGQQVEKNHKGLVIYKGRKYLQK